MMEISTYYGDNLCVTGSEESFSHKGTYNLDLGLGGGKGTRKRYAPFTCVVKAIDTNYNTITCESVGPVIMPRFPKGEFACFSVGHRNVMKYKVGQTIKQGEYLGDDGLKGTSQVHTHWSFGVGRLKMPNFLTKVGTYNGKTGIYALACTIGWIHSYDFWFVPDSTPITTAKDNPAFKYPWKRLSSVVKEEVKPPVKPPMKPPVVKEITVRGKLIKKEGNVYTLEGKEI